MVRTPLLAALAGALLLGGCANGDSYENRTYAGEGWGNRPYYSGYPYRDYGYSRPAYGYGYGSPDADRYYRRHRNDDDDGKGKNRRLVRTERNVVCDRRTEVCYKNGDIDASETREYFGKDEARRVDRIRDRYKDNDIFLPRGNTVCREENRTCYVKGEPDRRATREYFGKKAARRVDND